MIIRIATEDQYEIAGDDYTELNDLDDAVVAAVEAGDSEAYGSALELRAPFGPVSDYRSSPRSYRRPPAKPRPYLTHPYQSVVRSLWSEVGRPPHPTHLTHLVCSLWSVVCSLSL